MSQAIPSRPRILLVGGMDYNIPEELKNRFEIVKHVVYGTKRLQDQPKDIDYIFVLSEWASHNIVETIKKQAKVPVVWLRKGWSAMKTELEQRCILPPERGAEDAAAKATPAPERAPAASTTGLSEDDLKRIYKAKVIEAVKATLKPKEKVTEDELLEAMSMSGLPKEDCRTVLEEWLHVSGVIDRAPSGRWCLMADGDTGFENDLATSKEEAIRAKRLTRRGMQVTERAKLIAGLPLGPYPTQKALVEKMKRYNEFDGLSDAQLVKAIKMATDLHIVDDTHEKLFVDHSDSIALTLVVTQEQEPELPAQAVPVMSPPPPKDEVFDHNAAWTRVLAATTKDRERIATLLGHCRIEWLPSNSVVCVLLPTPLEPWLKFLQSTDNWGFVSKIVQKEFTPSTVLRFMMENGLGG